MSEPKMVVKFENGDVFHVPARVIAEHRAKHYAERDPSTTYAEELEFTLGDDFELADWASNNMNWTDLSAHATLQPRTELKPVDFEAEWSNAEKLVQR